MIKLVFYYYNYYYYIALSECLMNYRGICYELVESIKQWENVMKNEYIYKHHNVNYIVKIYNDSVYKYIHIYIYIY